MRMLVAMLVLWGLTLLRSQVRVHADHPGSQSQVVVADFRWSQSPDHFWVYLLVVCRSERTRGRCQHLDGASPGNFAAGGILLIPRTFRMAVDRRHPGGNHRRGDAVHVMIR